MKKKRLTWLDIVLISTAGLFGLAVLIFASVVITVTAAISRGM